VGEHNNAILDGTETDALRFKDRGIYPSNEKTVKGKRETHKKQEFTFDMSADQTS
jgi:hypothetical protein